MPDKMKQISGWLGDNKFFAGDEVSQKASWIETALLTLLVNRAPHIIRKYCTILVHHAHHVLKGKRI